MEPSALTLISMEDEEDKEVKGVRRSSAQLIYAIHPDMTT
jgi:hypothetical protein